MPKIPEKYRGEFQRGQDALLKSRTSLFILTATAVYFLVTFFYLLRFLLGLVDSFRFEEIYTWAVLLGGSLVLYKLNAKSQSAARSKLYGHLFNLVIAVLVTRLGVIYASTVMVFPFYFGLGLMIVALTIPWQLRDILLLSLVVLVSHSVLYGAVTWGMGYPVPSLPRFHPYFDGFLFILLCALLCLLLAKKREERDIENFILLKEVEEKNDRIRRDLEFANRIHRSLVPEPVKTEKADIAVTYLPAAYVGGDYARFRFVEKDYLLFMIGDVTGHGVAAALLVNRIHAEFERRAKERIGPGALLQQLNEFIHQDFSGTGMYLSAFSGGIDFRRKVLSFSSYGHPPQYLYRVSNSEIEPLAAQRTLLGIDSDRFIYERQIPVERKDRILLFTDGILETRNASGAPYGSERIETFLKENHALGLEAFQQALLEDVKRHNKGGFQDDLFILSIDVK